MFAHHIRQPDRLRDFQIQWEGGQASIRPHHARLRFLAKQFPARVPFHGNRNLRIDSHASALFNAGEWTFPDTALRGVYARNCVYKGVTGWDSFEPALTKAGEADIIDIWRCAERIPPEWYEYDREGLERIVETVYHRRGNIRSLIDAFRSSSRDPFPNWKNDQKS